MVKKKACSRKFIQNIGLCKELFFHSRKYSFSEEESFNVDLLGIGGNIEKNVIYSQDSFLPRSVALNLTAEVFGHSLNVLEVSSI